MLFTLLLYICIPLLVLGLVGMQYRSMSGRCTSRKRLEGKTVLITGASAGIGKSAAYDLARRGARIIMACRNLKKAERVRDDIVKKTVNNQIEVQLLDTSDLDSVRACAERILKQESKIDILINNAGIVQNEYSFSKQGYELTLATNHLGHFLFTNLLLDLIKKSSPARIINVSSMAHAWNGFDLEDPHFRIRKYSPWKAYAQSKLCNVLFTKELHKRLLGSLVSVNVLHPGAVATEIGARGGGIGDYVYAFIGLFMKDRDLGAQTIIYLAVDEEVEGLSGEYFVDCDVAKISEKGCDEKLAKELWAVSEELCKMK